jgi:hypothetical protein
MFFETKIERIEKKMKREKWTGDFIPVQTCPRGYVMLAFLRLLNIIKSYFKGQSLNFMCTQ